MEFIEVPKTSGAADALPSSMLIALAVIAGLVLAYSFFAFMRNRASLEQKWREENIARNAPMRSADQQFLIPASTTFRATSIVNPESLQVLELLETLIWDVNSTFSVLIYVSLDQFLEQSASVNPVEYERTQSSLRREKMDYLVVNSNGLPVLAVMYYGHGPSQSPRRPGDPAIQMITGALNQAGIRFFEIQPEFRKRDLKKRLKQVLNSGIL